MTLDEFIVLQRNQVETFRTHHARGVRRFNWPADMTLDQWRKHLEKWQSIYDKWLRECGVDN